MNRTIQLANLARRVTSKHSRLKTILVLCLAAISFISLMFFGNRKASRTSDGYTSNSSITLHPGSELQQKIAIHGTYLESVGLQVNPSGTAGNLNVELKEDGKSIKSWSVPVSSLKIGQVYTFAMGERYKVHDGSDYTLCITDTEDTIGIAAYVNEAETADEYNMLSLDGEKYEDAVLCYHTTFYHGSEMKRTVIGGCILLAILMILYFIGLNEYAMMGVLLLGMGILWLIYLPKGVVPDEAHHWLRTFEISGGGFLCKHNVSGDLAGDYLPEGLYGYNYPDAMLNRKNLVPYTFSNMALYSPFSYLPQALFVFVGRLFTTRVSTLFTLARVGSFTVSFIFYMLALKVIPFGRKVMFMLMLSPMAMQEMVSIAPDGMTIALCFFIFSYVLHLFFQEDMISRKQIIWLSVCMLWLTQYKIVYIAMIFILYIISEDRFASKKDRLYARIVLPVCAVLCNLIWLRISSSYLAVTNPGVDSHAQIQYILTNIPGFIGIILNTLAPQASIWISQMCGTDLAALVVKTPSVFIHITELLFLLHVVLNHDIDRKVSWRVPIMMLIVFILTCGLILCSLFVQWTPVGNTYIAGIQGRYFLPVIPAATFPFIILFNERERRHGNTVVFTTDSIYLSLYLFTAGFVSLMYIVHYYF